MIVGIDLGTTNSAVGVWRDGKAQLVPNSLGQILTPSAVSVDDDGTVLVGMAARERQVTHPAATATCFKRYMGSRREATLGKKGYLPEELSALVLMRLKGDAEAFLGEAVKEAIITVPAYFNDKQRKATRRAGELAGLVVKRLVNEPTAAALSYGIHELERESEFLVFDLGGGTFDVSVLEIFEGLIEVRSSTGDNHLGGEDFNDVIVKDIRAKLPTALVRKFARDPLFVQRLRSAAERARRGLTDGEVGHAEIVWDGHRYDYELTADSFETLSRDLLARIREPVVRALKDANVRPETLTDVVLVGGATRMPVVRRAVTKMFGRFPNTRVNPDEAIALGAATLAGLKMRDVALKEVVLTDVCPYSLGVDTGERLPNDHIRTGIFCPIIERNTAVPASRVKTFFPIRDHQTLVRFGVYQGESRDVSANVALGVIEIPIPPKTVGEVSVDCRFTYDVSGLIEVDLLVPSTGERRQLVIVDDEEIAARDLAKRRDELQALKVHPRDLDVNRAALARVARCYETALGPAREIIGALMGRFEEVLSGQDPREIERACAELHAALDNLEGTPFL